MHPRAETLIRELGLSPHPEGGFYREVFRSRGQVDPEDGRGARSALTTIYFLLPGGAHSRWHRVTSDEAWHFYEGDPLELLLLPPDLNTLARHELGPAGAAAGGAPVCTVPAGWWQAARPLGKYALVGCSVGPGFDFADFSLLADDHALAGRVAEAFPDAARLR